MLKKILLASAFLAGTHGLFASGLCVTSTLAALNGTTVTCGAYTFDFTNLTFINGNTGFGPNDGTGGSGDGNGGTLTAADIIVKISYDPTINFSIAPGAGGVWVGDASFTDPHGLGQSTYDIEYDILVQSPWVLTQVASNGHNLGYDAVGGEIDVNKDVFYGPTDTDNPLGIYDIGAGFQEIHTAGPVTVPLVTSGLIPLSPYTATAHIVDSLNLVPVQDAGDGRVTMESFENTFATPEPATFLLIGSVLLGLGVVRRKVRV